MSNKREALQMALEMIEFNKHERRHVRWAIKEALCGQPSIAQSIRDAAVNGCITSDFQFEILTAFCTMENMEVFNFKDQLNHGTPKEKMHSRTFMLLVAEALE